MINTMTINEAKTVIHNIASRDTTPGISQSEKRAKVLNEIIKHYTIISPSATADGVYSLEDIGTMLGVSKQYVKTIEVNAMEKLNRLLQSYNI